jgi:DNA gyrase subunit A
LLGRETHGVRIINVRQHDSIAAVAKVLKDDDEIEDVEDIEVDMSSESESES